VKGQTELLQIVAALRPPCRFARGLNRGQQQGDKDADDRDHHQQFDQSKTGTLMIWHDAAPVRREDGTI